MKRELFNEGWIFTEGAATTLSALSEASSGVLVEPKEVRLPHDAMIGTERIDFAGGANTGFFRPKNVFYTKEFTLSEEDRGKQIILEFESVYKYAMVYVNGRFAGKCTDGYTNYYFNITKYLQYEKPNKILVAIRNGCESARWYSGAGIYRDVWILKGNAMHIRPEGVRVTTESLENEFALLSVVTPVVSAETELKTVRVKTTVTDPDGNVAGCADVPLTMQEAGEKEVTQYIAIENPRKWSAETPDVYTVSTVLEENGTEIDGTEDRFGIRVLTLDAVRGLRVNGESVKLKGGCLHHDSGIIGTATFKEMAERRLKRLKKAGYNAIRTGAHPISRVELDICDRIGLYVYDELTDVWNNAKVAFDPSLTFEESWERDLENLVRRDYNHPSVIFLGIGNEIQEITTPEGQDMARKLAAKVHSIDRTRFTTLSMNPIMPILEHMDEFMADFQSMAAAVSEAEETASAIAELGDGAEVNSAMYFLNDQMEMVFRHPKASLGTEEICAQVDIVGLNYATSMYEPDHERYPARVMFGSETYPKWLARNWELIEEHPYIVGDFCWTAWDYLGEAGIGEIDHRDEPKEPYEFYGNWPWKTAAVGTFDLIGDELPEGYWRELVWNNRTAPYIAVRPPQFYGRPTHGGNWSWISDAQECWTWPGYEGKPVQVEVYSKAEEVELFVNGKSCGKQKPGTEFYHTALFETVYEPGEIRAVDSNGEEFIIRSARDESVISAYIDPEELAKKDREITAIELSICDGNGVLNANSDKTVHIEIEGDGVIQGFGSADPLSTENFFDLEAKAYHGRLLAVIRHNPTHGAVKVTFKADGCEDTIIDLA